MKSIKIRLIGGIGFHPINMVADSDVGQRITRKSDKTSKKVVRDFDFDFDPDPLEVYLTIEIPAPEWATSTSGDASETEQIHLPLRASTTHRGFDVKPGNFPHPRMIHLEQLSGSQGTLLVIDISFLEVTKYLSASELGALAKTTSYKVIPRTAQLREFSDDVYRSRRPTKGLVEFYELTVNESPRLWAVSFHQPTLAKRPFNFAVFFIPKTPSYDHPGAANLYSLRRYLLSPSLAAPFFVKNAADHEENWNKYEHHQWIQNPDCGFIEQLLLSRANAVLVTPVPNGSGPGSPRYGMLKNFGEKSPAAAAGLPPYKKGIRFTLDSLRRAMLRGAHREMWRIAGAKIALGGFSAGAHDAIPVLRRNQRAIDQLYWFDPRTDWVRSFEPELVQWMNITSDKQLRLVGGNQHSPRPGFSKPDPQNTLIALRQRMWTRFPAARTSLVPDDPEFFRQSMYVHAVAAPAHAGMSSLIDAFDMSTAPAQSAPTRETGVFIEAYPTTTAPLKLEGRNVGEPPRPSSQRDTAAVPCNSMELAGLMRIKYILSDRRTPLHQSKNGPRMSNEVALSIASMTETTRHQWAACGGDGDPLRNSAFVGHLHDCLKKGGM